MRRATCHHHHHSLLSLSLSLSVSLVSVALAQPSQARACARARRSRRRAHRPQNVRVASVLDRHDPATEELAAARAQLHVRARKVVHLRRGREGGGRQGVAAEARQQQGERSRARARPRTVVFASIAWYSISDLRSTGQFAAISTSLDFEERSICGRNQEGRRAGRVGSGCWAAAQSASRRSSSCSDAPSASAYTRAQTCLRARGADSRRRGRVAGAQERDTTRTQRALCGDAPLLITSCSLELMLSAFFFEPFFGAICAKEAARRGGGDGVTRVVARARGGARRRRDASVPPAQQFHAIPRRSSRAGRVATLRRETGQGMAAERTEEGEERRLFLRHVSDLFIF